ncbi:MerR family transcriptional regulator [Gottschalkiaceae bacterium SANA]|nr:MerR family transcriptional regulator [Gottschalkiaceae bacterium SANA]
MRLLIGEFAKLHGVGLQTLHHYDSKGILKPAWVDPKTGYRFYDEESSDQLWKIKALKSAGLSLGEIRDLLGADLSYTEAIFQKLSKELKMKMERDRRVLQYLNRSIRSMEKWGEGNWVREPMIVEISKRTGHVIEVQDSYDIEKRFRALETFQKKLPLHVDILYQPSRIIKIEEDERQRLVCYGALTEKPIQDVELIIPKGKFVVMDHIGVARPVMDTYKQILLYAEQEGYRRTGNALELFVIDPHLSSNAENWVRQIQVEIQK